MTRILQAVLTALLALLVSAGIGAQSPTKPAGKASASDVDTVIALVKGGMSEATVIKTLKREGKNYTLSTADLLKLQKAGVSERIIDAMSDPGAGGSTSAPPAAASSAKNDTAGADGASSSYPPDLPDVPAIRKRRVAIKPFEYATVTTWVNYWFGNSQNIGEGIRSMLSVRLGPSKYITMVERANIKDVMSEQDFGASSRVKKGSNAKIGQIAGADVMLYGEIVIFGRDDTTKRKNVGAFLGRISPVAGRVATMNKEEKAVVGINLRLVDAETGEQIETSESRGESSRSSKDYAGVLGIQGAAAGGASDMTSSNFQQTIIGEATSNAVSNIVSYLETKLPQLPAKARQIEGHVAQLTGNGAYLTVGTEDGVQRGDRFEILKINGEIKDPTTKEVIDIDAVKIGELVVDAIRDKSSSGRYGGQPLSAAYATSGKGYAARLISK
jgi:curli biogenesis system outer membrane secretion channel CsgG